MVKCYSRLLFLCKKFQIKYFKFSNKPTSAQSLVSASSWSGNLAYDTQGIVYRTDYILFKWSILEKMVISPGARTHNRPGSQCPTIKWKMYYLLSLSFYLFTMILMFFFPWYISVPFSWSTFSIHLSALIFPGLISFFCLIFHVKTPTNT